MATILEFRGSRFSHLQIFGVVDTLERMEQGDMICRQRHSRSRLRAVVPKKYTHVRIIPLEGGLKGRWELGFGTGEDCALLHGAVTGTHPTVLMHRGTAATATFELSATGDARLHHSAELIHFGLKGSKRSRLRHVGSGPYRGPIRLPGPGLVQVDALVPWSMTLDD